MICYLSLQATYADFAVAVLLDALATYKPGLLSMFPPLEKLKASVEALPSIAAWIARRPESSH